MVVLGGGPVSGMFLQAVIHAFRLFLEEVLPTPLRRYSLPPARGGATYTLLEKILPTPGSLITKTLRRCGI